MLPNTPPCTASRYHVRRASLPHPKVSVRTAHVVGRRCSYIFALSTPQRRFCMPPTRSDVRPAALQPRLNAFARSCRVAFVERAKSVCYVAESCLPFSSMKTLI